MDNRNYLAVSISLTGPSWVMGDPLVLYRGRTDINDPRNFDKYTCYLDEAEIYSLNDWRRSPYYPSARMQLCEAQSIDENLCNMWRQYDTILVRYSDYKQYCEQYNIPTSNAMKDVQKDGQLECQNKKY